MNIYNYIEIEEFSACALRKLQDFAFKSRKRHTAFFVRDNAQLAKERNFKVYAVYVPVSDYSRKIVFRLNKNYYDFSIFLIIRASRQIKLCFTVSCNKISLSHRYYLNNKSNRTALIRCESSRR